MGHPQAQGGASNFLSFAARLSQNQRATLGLLGPGLSESRGGWGRLQWCMKQTFGTQPIFLEGLWKTPLYLLLPKVSPSLRENTLKTP